MSGKRSPEEAFGKHEPASPHSPKRKRRARKPEQRAAAHKRDPVKDQLALDTAGERSRPAPSPSPQYPTQAPVHKKNKTSKKSKKIGKRFAEYRAGEKEIKGSDKVQQGWTLSAGTGGIFLNQDPILTLDDKYLLLPTASCVQVYSTTTSLLVRSLDVGQEHSITSCCLNPSKPTEIFIATTRGSLSRWDWTTGHKIHQWRCRKGITRIIGTLGVADDYGDQVLLLHETSEGQSEVSHRSLDNSSSSTAAGKVILSSGRPVLPTLRASVNGEVLVLCAGDRLYLGQLNQRHSDASYTWREATVPGIITSLDARFHEKPTKSGQTRTAVDVVVGLNDGVVLIYEDVLYCLIGKEKGYETADIISRRLHWHRDAVKTVKWSRDGNYLISGGNETVLVIWQLDTNQRQFLPHLSTSILNVTVSAAGSSYALRLADNSVMVLSTADLKPYASVSSLAVSQAGGCCPPAVMHPRNPNQLIAAVPRLSTTTSQRRNEKSNATMVQTFDVGAGFQVNRQALTRNVTTTINISPTGNNVVEPDVVLLKVSHDGQWLVTVDEWCQPDTDLDPMYPISDETRNKRQPKETCLRFWHWNEESRNWGLVTRVDAPHAKSTVLGLAVNPTSLELASVGGDGCLRIWSPKSRHRSGVAVKNQAGEQLHTWTCSTVTQIERELTGDEGDEEPLATVTYSEDGSVIATSCSIAFRNPRLIHFIDSQSGTTRLSQPGLLTEGKADIAFLGRHLLCLSRGFQIWDTVNSKTTFAVALKDVFSFMGSASVLAVNKMDNSFAIGFNTVHIQGSSQIAVFDINKLKEGPLSQIEVRGHVKLLLSQSKASGFVIVDEQNRARQLMPPGSARLSTSSVAAQREAVTNSLDNIFGSMPLAAQPDGEAGELVRALPAPEVRAGMRSMEDLLGISASSKGRSIGDLFAQVAGIFARPAAAA